MDSEKFIHCCVCDAIHHVSPFDKAPAFVLVGDEVEAQATDDWRLFMTQHAGHRLEPLRASGEKLFPGGSPLDSDECRLYRGDQRSRPLCSAPFAKEHSGAMSYRVRSRSPDRAGPNGRDSRK